MCKTQLKIGNQSFLLTDLNCFDLNHSAAEPEKFTDLPWSKRQRHTFGLNREPPFTQSFLVMVEHCYFILTAQETQHGLPNFAS